MSHLPEICSPTAKNGHIDNEGGLPARAVFQPVQAQHLLAGVPQPSRNLSFLKRPISGTEVAIEQLCDFFSRARLFDPVQRSKDMLIETAVRIGRLTHLRFSGLKVELLRGTHLCSVRLQLVTASQEGPVGKSWRINLRMASGSCSPAAPAKVYDRSKPFGPSTLMSQFSLACDPAMDTRHSPRLSLSACSTLTIISRHS